MRTNWRHASVLLFRGLSIFMSTYLVVYIALTGGLAIYLGILTYFYSTSVHTFIRGLMNLTRGAESVA